MSRFSPSSVKEWNTVNASLAEIAYNVKSPKYGGIGDGLHDDTSAIQNAINDAMNNGGDVFFPSGYYRVTQPIKVGQSIYTLSDVVNYANSYSQNSSAVTANEVYYPIGLIFSSTVGIFADFAPANLEAVIEYNLVQNNTSEQNSQGKIIGGLSIYGQGYFSNGKPSATGSTPANNNLIGLFACAGAREIANVKCVGLGYGIVNADAYWQKVRDCYGKNNGTCFYFRGFNAGISDNLEMWYSTNGIICDGSQMDIRSFSTEEVLNDILINQGDGSTFGPAYLEDVGSSDGTGSYAINMGSGGLTECTFRSIRVSSVRTNKKSFNIKNSKGTVFLNCRNYNIAFDYDTASNGSFIEGDSTFKIFHNTSWTNITQGNLDFGLISSEQTYSVSVLEPFVVSIPSTSVPANGNVVVTGTINNIALTNVYRFALIGRASGIDPNIVLTATISGTTVSVYLQNISTSAITTTGTVAGLILGLN